MVVSDQDFPPQSKGTGYNIDLRQKPTNPYNNEKTSTLIALSLVAFTANAQSCPDNHHPHRIDLGLPTGTLWACCNVGATTPEAYGGYYAWGETKMKAIYNWSNYSHCEGPENTCKMLGDITGTQYDVAHVKWGGSWVMPSHDQINELLNNCTYEKATINGVRGRKFTSKKNGSIIFLPTAGRRDDGTPVNVGFTSDYWSSTQGSSPKYANDLYLVSSRAEMNFASECYNGYTVRPVSK